MIYLVLLVVLVLMGVGLWRFAAHARDVDEDLKYLNEGQVTGRGIFGIFSGDRDR